MENVFDAGTNIEAHMIANLLERHGINAQVFGEHLQSAVGEIGAHGNIRVMVDASDVAEARRIIREWEQQQVEPEPEEYATQKSTSKGFGILPFILGAATATAACFWYFTSEYDAHTADYDDDGKIDEWFYYSRDRLLRIEADRNGDGEVDYVTKYSNRGIAETSTFDNDFNGSFEELLAFRNAQPVFSEVDLNGNRQPDIRFTYVNGVFTKQEIYRPGTRIVRKASVFEMGHKLVEARWDSNDDGILDTLITYGPFEEEISRSALDQP